MITKKLYEKILSYRDNLLDSFIEQLNLLDCGSDDTIVIYNETLKRTICNIPSYLLDELLQNNEDWQNTCIAEYLETLSKCNDMKLYLNELVDISQKYLVNYNELLHLTKQSPRYNYIQTNTDAYRLVLALILTDVFINPDNTDNNVRIFNWNDLSSRDIADIKTEKQAVIYIYNILWDLFECKDSTNSTDVLQKLEDVIGNIYRLYPKFKIDGEIK